MVLKTVGAGARKVTKERVGRDVGRERDREREREGGIEGEVVCCKGIPSTLV